MKTILALALSLSASMAFAHADLESAAPADGASAAAPTEVVLTFSEAVSLAFTGATVTGPLGVIAAGAAVLDSAGTVLTLPLTAPLPAGDYTVDWHALSEDGHKSKGSYSFTVK